MGDKTLLDRKAFRDAVFRRDGGRCVFCGAPAVDSHHVLERKLYPCGGYYVDNGASVCERHHWDCETTRIPVEEVRRAAGIVDPALPPGFSPDKVYDKWGNQVRRDGTRIRGPLYDDDGARKALAQGGCLGLFYESNDA